MGGRRAGLFVRRTGRGAVRQTFSGLEAQGFGSLHRVSAGAIAVVSLPGNPPIDVVITALSLPKLNGVLLASALHRTNPDLPIIALGGDPLRCLRTPDDAKVAAVLTKPCSLVNLREIILRCLGQSGQACRYHDARLTPLKSFPAMTEPSELLTMAPCRG